MTHNPQAGHAIILFDGVCNFCNSSVNFIMKRDARGYFRFAPLQSPRGQELQERFGLETDRLETFVLVEGERAHLRSAAALRIARRLGGLYPLLYAFIIVPPFIRDFVYGWFARNRYRWFGKRDECMVPTPDMRDRFLPD